jgi:RNA-directed DNA polymerase
MSNMIDAASHPIPWHHINWRRAHGTVNRLQSRIVKALQEGNKRKVRALQNLLTHSLAAAALAVRQVTENTGKRTPGIDKEIWRTNHQKTAAVQKVRTHHYRAKPLRRIYIPKLSKPNEKRPLSIPCMIDRAKQALYLLALDPIAEYYGDLNSYGFRKKRSTADAIEACHKFLSRNCSPKWVLEGDIKACFDTISHSWLLKWIPMDKRILAQWLKAGYMDRHVFYPTNKGTPQGGIASPVLMNLTLDGLELHLKLQFRKQKVNVVRYADDFIVTGDSKELLENKIKPSVENFLQTRGLFLSKEKTHITHIKDGFDFLGFNIRKFGEKLIIQPAKTNIKEVRTKIKTISRKFCQRKPEEIIKLLNLVIRGWANYYQHVNSVKTFSYLDHETWKILWHWAERRHPTKGKRWIKGKYFKVTERSSWNFSGKTPNDRDLLLAKFRDVKIKRHIKIRGEANPYDPQYAYYFEQRRKQKIKGTKQSEGIRKLLLRQKGNCFICKQEISKQSGWHLHHVIRRCDGGKTHQKNLVLLHPTCHDQWHHRDYECNTGLSRKVFERA